MFEGQSPLPYEAIFTAKRIMNCLDNNLTVHGYATNSDLQNQASMMFGNDHQQPLAKRVYQIGFDGSTFPVGFWPVKTWKFVDVLTTTMEAIEMLRRKDFMVNHNCIQFVTLNL